MFPRHCSSAQDLLQVLLLGVQVLQALIGGECPNKEEVAKALLQVLCGHHSALEISGWD